MSIQRHNYLSANRFTFALNRCPNLTHFCQRINIPAISFGISLQANPTGIEIRRPGTGYAFEDISLGFIVDEKMANWKEIFEWMKEIGIYTSTNEISTEPNKVSEASLLITNSAYKPIIKVIYHNIFPNMLSGLDFDVSILDTEAMTAQATFAFTHYDVELL